MNASPEDLLFLRELVKASRQRVHHLTWTDRDGTKRLTALTQPEFARLRAVSSGLKLSPAEVLRQAAHIPRQDHPNPDGREQKPTRSNPGP